MMNYYGVDFSYSYDENGNMISGPDFTDPAQVATKTITYNTDNMPSRIDHTKGGNLVITDLFYDGDAVRVKKSVQGGSTTYYIGEHFEVKGTTETKYIFAGNLRVAKVTTSATSFYHKDHLGSSTVMTTYPAGSSLETTEYLPFGHQREHTGTEVSDYKFTDQELDTETGLYNYDARLYDPLIGWFISPDTLVPYLYDPQSLNRYSYCRNNPLRYTDPDGHWHIGVAIGAISGAIGGFTTGIQSGNPTAGFIGGLVGAVAGAVAGSVNPGAAGPVGAAVAASVVGGATGRGTAAAYDAAQKGNDPVSAAIDAVADPGAVATDVVSGAAAGWGTTGLLGRVGVNTTKTATSFEKAAAAAFAGTIDRSVNNLSNSASMVTNSNRNSKDQVTESLRDKSDQATESSQSQNDDGESAGTTSDTEDSEDGSED